MPVSRFSSKAELPAYKYNNALVKYSVYTAFIHREPSILSYLWDGMEAVVSIPSAKPGVLSIFDRKWQYCVHGNSIFRAPVSHVAWFMNSIFGWMSDVGSGTAVRVCIFAMAMKGTSAVRGLERELQILKRGIYLCVNVCAMVWWVVLVG